MGRFPGGVEVGGGGPDGHHGAILGASEAGFGPNRVLPPRTRRIRTDPGPHRGLPGGHAGRRAPFLRPLAPSFGKRHSRGMLHPGWPADPASPGVPWTFLVES